MKKILIYTFFVFFAYSALAKGIRNDERQVKVEINYGEQKAFKSIMVEWRKELTALEALQISSNVETHPVGPLVFVTSIDQVAGERGKMAWYYQVNGKPADQLAIDKILKPGDTVSWRFVEDVCSKTVDCKK